MCFGSSGFDGLHNNACTNNLPVRNKSGKPQRVFAQIAQQRLQLDSAFPPAIYYRLEYSGSLPTTQYKVLLRGWDTFVKASLYYAKGKKIYIITGLWGAGVYNNPIDVVMESFINIANLYPNIDFIFCYPPNKEKEVSPYFARQTTTMTIIKDDMFKVASRTADAYPNGIVFLHNFANGYQAGGGAANGQDAQEESLCRDVTGVFKSLLLVNEKEEYHLLGEKAQDARCQYTNALITLGCNLAANPGGNKFAVISMAAPNQSKNFHGDPGWKSFPKF
jgi:hypothetical protein